MCKIIITNIHVCHKIKYRCYIDNVKMLLQKINDAPRQKLIKYISLALLTIFIFLILRYQIELSQYIEWQDESETIVVTKMMASGMRLYTEVYNNHGPLTFLIGTLISFIGNFSIKVYRYPMYLLQVLVILSIYFSPIFKKFSLNRLAATVIPTLLWLFFFPYIYGHTYTYQTQSGLLLVLVFSQYALPLYFDENLNKYQKIGGPFLIICLPFFAITNAPIALLLLISTFKKSNLKESLIGIVLALLLNLLFITFFSSFKGYYAYHFYMNSLVLNEGKGILGYVITIFEYYRYNFTNLMTLFILLGFNLFLFKSIKKEEVWRVLFIIPMFMSLVIRGGEVFDLFGLVYLYGITGLSIVLFVDENYHWFKELFYGLLIMISLLLVGNISSISNDFWAIPHDSQFSLIVQRVTSKDEKIQALTFRSFEYLLSDRLPASSHFIYLPIQATYNQNPFMNIKSDILIDLKKAKPKLIYMDEWSPDIPWVEYAKDVDEYIKNNYIEIADTNIFYRKDINLYEYNVDPYTGVLLN